MPGTMILYCSSSTKALTEDERCYFELRLNYRVRLIIIYWVSLICFIGRIRGQDLSYGAL